MATPPQLDAVPINQVSGIVSLQQNLRRLCVYRMLRSLREVLVDTVEERRAPPPSPPSHHELVESWRIVATAKLTDNLSFICHRIPYKTC